MAYLLGIDIGTSGTKTVLFNYDGAVVASSLREYPLYQAQAGWAEQDPEDWWTAVVETVKEILSKNGVYASDIKAIGLSGQMHGLVMLDKDGNCVRKSIIWCDQRTHEQCEQITDKVGSEKLIEITANPALTGFTASKLLWVRDNEPENYDKTVKILLPKDYIRYRLTGQFATEVSDASGMQFLNIAERKWSQEILDRLGVDKNLLADVYESQQITGDVSKYAAQLTGLKPATPVVGGGGDQAAGAVGNGIVRSGIVSSTIGSSGVVFACTNKVTIDKKGRVHTFCHAIPGVWHVMGVTQGAGLSLKWFRDNFFKAEMETADAMEVDPYFLMDKQAEMVAPGVDGLIYLPYLMGERTPHLDPYARGVFFGLSAIHQKRDMLRAVMEGVSYSLKDCMEIIKEMDIPVNEVRASGGGGKSILWRQMQSDMFNTGICTINSAEGPALGAAIIAGAGAGVYSSIEQGCDAAIKTISTQWPIAKNVEIYKKYYEKYKNIYLALKPQFR